MWKENNEIKLVTAQPIIITQAGTMKFGLS